MFLYLFNKVYVYIFYYIILVGFGFNNIIICYYFMLKKNILKYIVKIKNLNMLLIVEQLYI